MEESNNLIQTSEIDIILSEINNLKIMRDIFYFQFIKPETKLIFSIITLRFRIAILNLNGFQTNQQICDIYTGLIDEFIMLLQDYKNTDME